MVTPSRVLSLGACTVGLFTALPTVAYGEPAKGPLRLCEQNPRYFATPDGRAVYLTGAHTWTNLQDMGPSDPPEAFDWDAYLGFLEGHHHNFVRLWRWELTRWDTSANGEGRLHICSPHPWARTGPGEARDGKPRFDLERFDDAYFERLRHRVESAQDRGIYVSIMLFEGWGMQFVPDALAAHPFHPDNNVNGINGDTNGDGKGLEIHELVDPRITAIQEAYVRKVIDTVNDLDNVLYEISNENHPPSTEWQCHIIRLVKEYESKLPKQHPVGMTFQYEGGSNQTLFDSPADWVSPNPDGGYRDDPRVADGRRVVLSDTDHLWGIGGSRQWVWKSFLRGYNPLFMDPYDGSVLETNPQWEDVRRNLGYTLRLAERIDLARAVPLPDLASTGYCLAIPGEEYVVYLPDGGSVTVDLSAADGELRGEWLNPSSGEITRADPVQGGGKVELRSPFDGDAVLHLLR